MGQAQINVRTRACSRTSIARTRQAALTHNVRGKELTNMIHFVSVLYVRKRNVGIIQMEPEIIQRTDLLLQFIYMILNNDAT